MSVMPELKENDDLKERTCSVLGVREDTDPSPEEARKNPSNLGADIIKVVALLFKN